MKRVGFNYPSVTAGLGVDVAAVRSIHHTLSRRKINLTLDHVDLNLIKIMLVCAFAIYLCQEGACAGTSL
jgi:hypothetical protein